MFGHTMGSRAMISSRLQVEQLETRDCPATLSLSTIVLANHQVLLSGTVTGDDVAGTEVYFSGAANGSVMVDESGYFSFTTADASIGTVCAIGYDTDSHEWTNYVTDQVALTSPTITLTVGSIVNNLVVLQGHVDSIDRDALTVSLSGPNGLSATAEVDSEGNFSVLVQMNQLGPINAWTTDLWGQNSNTVQLYVTSDAPLVYDVVCRQVVGTTYVFTGRVSDENPNGLIVRLSGIPSLEGRTAIVQEDGTWSIDGTVAANEVGMLADFTTVDWFGQTSNVGQVQIP